MRTLCDVCESAAAILFCAADEAALCRSCDETVNTNQNLTFNSSRMCLSTRTLFKDSFSESVAAVVIPSKVHMCNKLASRHVRVGLADPSEVPRCDICENAPAFFYCEVDGSSLCLQCDMVVHVGGKRTHGRYLLLRQRVEFPGDKSARPEEQGMQTMDPGKNRREFSMSQKPMDGDNQQNHTVPFVLKSDANADDGHTKMDTEMIDLNMKPHRFHAQASNNQEL